MKPHELIDSPLIRTMGSPSRIKRQVTALRKEDAGVYPKGSKARNAEDVYAMHAANLVLLIVSDPNPFNPEAMQAAAHRLEVLKPFLTDFARILGSGGYLGARHVEKICISLDRPAAQIKFADSFISYGPENELKVENWAILSTETLKEFSELINKTK